MAEKTKIGFDKCLKTKMGDVVIYLYKSWDLTHGIGWFSHTYNQRDFRNGFGFDAKNKFTAVRKAMLLNHI
jgi:hypothetical protein